MALPSSGSLRASQINVELGRGSNNRISLNDSAVRQLAGKSSGRIAFSDLRGKSAYGYVMNPSSFGSLRGYLSGSNASRLTPDKFNGHFCHSFRGDAGHFGFVFETRTDWQTMRVKMGPHTVDFIFDEHYGKHHYDARDAQAKKIFDLVSAAYNNNTTVGFDVSLIY